MPVANMVDISPDLTYNHTVELLAEAYNNRRKTKEVAYYINVKKTGATFSKVIRKILGKVRKAQTLT